MYAVTKVANASGFDFEVMGNDVWSKNIKCTFFENLQTVNMKLPS